MVEQWKPVPGYDGLYEVSDHGNVRSLDRVTTDAIRHETHWASNPNQNKDKAKK